MTNPISNYLPDERWPKFPANGPDGEAVAVACDAEDRVFVFLRGPRPVQVFEPNGTLLTTWGEKRFVRPHGITIHQDLVYCTDDMGHNVHVFTAAGQHLRAFTDGRASDTGATSIDYRTIQRSGPPFHYPTNVAIAPSGEIFITDGYGNARVHRYSATEKLLQSWGEPGAGPGQFHVPHGIAVDAEGMIHVCDRENSRVQRFTATGDYLGEWTNVARPSQIAFDDDGCAYVAELGFRAGRWPGTGEAELGATGGRVSILDQNGNTLVRFGGGEKPCAPGDFYAPHGICVDSHGAIYVTEVAWTAGGAAGRVDGSCHTLQKFVRR